MPCGEMAVRRIWRIGTSHGKNGPAVFSGSKEPIEGFERDLHRARVETVGLVTSPAGRAAADEVGGDVTPVAVGHTGPEGGEPFDDDFGHVCRGRTEWRIVNQATHIKLS